MVVGEKAGDVAGPVARPDGDRNAVGDLDDLARHHAARDQIGGDARRPAIDRLLAKRVDDVGEDEQQQRPADDVGTNRTQQRRQQAVDVEHLQLGAAIEAAQGPAEPDPEADVEEAGAERRHAEQCLAEERQQALSALGERVEQPKALNQEHQECGDGEKRHCLAPEKSKQVSA